MLVFICKNVFTMNDFKLNAYAGLKIVEGEPTTFVYYTFYQQSWLQNKYIRMSLFQIMIVPR